MTRTASKKPVDGVSRRRKDRANVAGRLNGVYLRCEQLVPGRELLVCNISELGLGVEARHVKKAPGPEEVLDAKLLVGATVAPVSVRVVHAGPLILGLEFVEPSGLLRGAIQLCFEPELHGASLRPVGAAEPAPGKKVVYESKKDSRLEIEVSAQGAASRFTISVLGSLVCWDAKGGLRLEQNHRQAPVPEFLLKQLGKFVRSADRVEPGLREQVLSVLMGTYGLRREGGGR